MNYRVVLSPEAEQVSIISVFYGGQDYATILQDNSDDDPKH